MDFLCSAERIAGPQPVVKPAASHFPALQAVQQTPAADFPDSAAPFVTPHSSRAAVDLNFLESQAAQPIP